MSLTFFKYTRPCRVAGSGWIAPSAASRAWNARQSAFARAAYCGRESAWPPPQPVSVTTMSAAALTRTATALRDGHRRTGGDGAGMRAPRLPRAAALLGRLAQELPPDEEGRRADEHHERDPEVDPLAEEVVRRVDPQRLLVRAERRVPGDVEREQRRPPQLEAAVDPEQHADAEQIPDELVQERRVERRLRPVRVRPVRGRDLQPPRQRGRLPEQLLVPVVADPADSLREQEAGRDRVHHQPPAVPRAADDHGAGRHPERDPAPDAEPALPDRERAPPVVRYLVPARDVVVEPRADDPEPDAPDGDAEDQIPIPAPADPARAGQPDAGHDAEQQHQAVHVDRQRADVDDAGVRGGDRRE